MRILKVYLIAVLASAALTGCNAQRNTNTGANLPATNTSPPSAQRPLAGTDTHDHAAETAVPRVGVTEAEAAVKRGEAIILDVRQPAAYSAGRIRGAILMPEAEIASRAPTLPKHKKIITYCT